MEKPGFIILVLIFTLLVVLTSCNKNEVIEPGELPECVEGWYPSEDSGSVFYLDCPDDVNSNLGCTKYFLVLMQVENLNPIV